MKSYGRDLQFKGRHSHSEVLEDCSFSNEEQHDERVESGKCSEAILMIIRIA